VAKIEAQIALQLRGELGLREANDVLLVKLPGSPWSDTEQTECRIVEMDSEDYSSETLAATIVALHDEMVAERDAGEPSPIIVHPFAVMSQPDENGHSEMVERSTVQLDLNDLDPSERSDTLDIAKKTDVLRATAAVKLKADLRGTPR
jgi:hypothetical protein